MPTRHRVRLRSLGADTNIPMLAQSIVDRCEFIGSGRVAVVIGLLYELQAHVIDNGLSEVRPVSRCSCVPSQAVTRGVRDLQAFAPPKKASSGKPPKAPGRQVSAHGTLWRVPREYQSAYLLPCCVHAAAAQGRANGSSQPRGNIADADDVSSGSNPVVYSS